MEIAGEFGIGEIVVNSRHLLAPHRIGGLQTLDGRVVVLVASRSHDKNEDSDFDLTDPGRNIVAIDSSGKVVWTVSDAPRESDTTETSYYNYIFTVGGDLYARGVDNRIYEIDPSDGEIERSFDSGVLPIDDKQIPIDGWIVKVVEFRDKIFVSADSLYGFDTAGNELWRDEERRGLIYKDGEVLIEKVSHGPRTKIFYRLDPDTGERLAEIEVETNYWGWEYVRDTSDDE